MITSTCLNVVEHVNKLVELVSKPPVSSYIPIKPMFIQHVKIAIPPDTFQQHLLKTFFQLEVGEMEINEMLAWIIVQNLYIAGWIVTKKKQFSKINLGSKENLQHVKFSVDLELVVSHQLIELLKEFKDIFAWTYKDLKGIPPNVVQHWIELDTLIPPAHQARYWLNPNYATIVKHDINKLLTIGFI